MSVRILTWDSMENKKKRYRIGLHIFIKKITGGFTVTVTQICTQLCVTSLYPQYFNGAAVAEAARYSALYSSMNYLMRWCCTKLCTVAALYYTLFFTWGGAECSWGGAVLYSFSYLRRRRTLRCTIAEAALYYMYSFLYLRRRCTLLCILAEAAKCTTIGPRPEVKQSN